MSFTIDPNLRDVLEDITTSKKSALFAGTYLKNVHEAYTIPEGRFAAMRLGMGAAERHLLETYRSELSMVLLQGFYKNFFEVEEFASKVHNLGEIPAAEPLEERARFARDSAPRDAFVGKTTHWLRRLLEGRPIAKAEDLESMLTAAIGLRDRPEARVYMGWGRYVVADWDGAVNALLPVFSSGLQSCSRLTEVLSLLSNARFQAGDWPGSLRSGAAAIRYAWDAEDAEGAVAEFSNLVAHAALIGEFEVPAALAQELSGIGELASPRASEALCSDLKMSDIPLERQAEYLFRASESLGMTLSLEEGGGE